MSGFRVVMGVFGAAVGMAAGAQSFYSYSGGLSFYGYIGGVLLAGVFGAILGFVFPGVFKWFILNSKLEYHSSDRKGGAEKNTECCEKSKVKGCSGTGPGDKN